MLDDLIKKYKPEEKKPEPVQPSATEILL